MSKKKIIKNAFREDANVVGLAGAAALSLALLNPLPLLVGVVAEMAYLLYVPDSRWYAQRLAQRFDAEILERRKNQQEELFPTLSEPVRKQFQKLEILRARLTAVSVDAAAKKPWAEFLRETDYLMEVLLQMCAKQSRLPSEAATAPLPQESNVDEMPDVVKRQRLLYHYEKDQAELHRVALRHPDTVQRGVLSKGIAELERNKDVVRLELFQLVLAQHLAVEVTETLEDTITLLRHLPRRLDQHEISVADVRSESARLMEQAELLSDRITRWLEQGASVPLQIK